MAKDRDDEYAGTGDGDAVETGKVGKPIDPATLISGDDGYERNDDGSVRTNADGSPRRKRGRRAGGTGGAGSRPGSKVKSAVNLTGVEAILLSTHAMVAAAIKQPAVALEQKEAEQLSKAIAEVARHYDTSVDPKVLAWFNLVAIIAMIYGPRIFILMRGDKSADVGEAKATPASGTVTTLDFGRVG